MQTVKGGGVIPMLQRGEEKFWCTGIVGIGKVGSIFANWPMGFNMGKLKWPQMLYPSVYTDSVTSITESVHVRVKCPLWIIS